MKKPAAVNAKPAVKTAAKKGDGSDDDDISDDDDSSDVDDGSSNEEDDDDDDEGDEDDDTSDDESESSEIFRARLQKLEETRKRKAEDAHRAAEEWTKVRYKFTIYTYIYLSISDLCLC